MRILITNDDGIQSPGLQSLVETLSGPHEVWVMAPDGDRSGYSHSITLKDPVKISRKGERMYSCSGTPVDCVVYAEGGYLDVEFDLILSGINIGPNLGTDLLYSGTAAAARQGALKGVPSIALSLNKFEPPYDFNLISEYILSRLENLVSHWDERCFLNMNFPAGMIKDAPLLWTFPARRIYHDDILRVPSPREEGTDWCLMKGSLLRQEEEEGSDVKAVLSGSVSLSAIQLAPSALSRSGRLPEEAGIL